jgi:hypothetical protein
MCSGDAMSGSTQTDERANAQRRVLDLLSNSRGGMAEWSMAVVLKTTEPETVPGVRIPLPPPPSLISLAIKEVERGGQMPCGS